MVFVAKVSSFVISFFVTALVVCCFCVDQLLLAFLVNVLVLPLNL